MGAVVSKPHLVGEVHPLKNYLYDLRFLSFMRRYIYMVLAALCFGTIGVLVKLIGEAVPPMTLNFYRVFFGLVFLLIIVPLIDKNTFKITKKDAKEFFLIGVILAVALSLYTTANLYTPIQNAVLINYSYPFFVLIFAYFFLREQITKTKIITLAAASIGLLIINPFMAGANSFGNTLAFLGAIGYGILIVAMRKEDKTHTIGDVFWFFLFASIILLPFPFIYGFGELSGVFVFVLLLGFLSTGLTYIFYTLALEKLEAETCSIIAMIITPLVSVILAFLIVNEAIVPRIILGGLILILSGIYLETHNKQLKGN